MYTQKFNVGELRRVVKESQNEFKPVVFGNDDSKKINDKAYADIKKETSKYDGGLTNFKKKPNAQIVSDNKGMGDLEYDNINKQFQDKVKSQMKGYASKQAEDLHKNDAYGNADYDNEGNFYKASKEHAEKSKWGKDMAAEIAPEGDKIKDGIKKSSKTMYEENKKIKRLNFKKITFISENHMLSNIPDEYKKEGNKFIMRDGAKNEYLVEWKSNDPQVTKKVNMSIVNEEKERIKQLWGYKSPEAHTSSASFRLKENNEFGDMVNKARNMILK